VGTRSRICRNGRDVWVAWRVHAVTKVCLGLCIQPEDSHYLAPKHVVLCVINNIYFSTI